MMMMMMMMMPTAATVSLLLRISFTVLSAKAPIIWAL
jgi:hypothetical protein